MMKDMPNTPAHGADHPDGCPHQPMADGHDAPSASPADTFTPASDVAGLTRKVQATMNDEPIDLRQVITDYAKQLRDDYTRRMDEPTPWVLPPRIYDEAARQIEAGTAKPETIAVMRNAVRAEEWKDND